HRLPAFIDARRLGSIGRAGIVLTHGVLHLQGLSLFETPSRPEFAFNQSVAARSAVTAARPAGENPGCAGRCHPADRPGNPAACRKSAPRSATWPSGGRGWLLPPAGWSAA